MGKHVLVKRILFSQMKGYKTNDFATTINAFGIGVGVGLISNSVARKTYKWLSTPRPIESKSDNKNSSESVPEHCPGTKSDQAGKADACAGCPNQKICASGEANAVDPAVSEIFLKLAQVKHKVLVLSGKGGVGKSTVSAQLAYSLSAQGLQVGLLDIDICGPSVPHLMGLRNAEVHKSALGWEPVVVNPNLCVMSVGFLLPNDRDAVIWRGPKKNGLIRQFLTDVNWGELDVLLVDTPPGTSDEHLSIVSYLQEAGIDGSVIVTTPQEVALLDVRKEITFCKKVGVEVLGVVENMSGGVFKASTGGAEQMSKEMEVPFLGRLPLHERLAEAGENGKMVESNSEPSKALKPLVSKLLSKLGEKDGIVIEGAEESDE
eukprot:GDKJ01056789.1.p1 GENE.GDKJ01056789.1~~GDKJ01056789.1.p1  ORF type:complete len:376 (-),score=91.96 GDKJ01056789.1:54-1181(-)